MRCMLLKQGRLGVGAALVDIRTDSEDHGEEELEFLGLVLVQNEPDSVRESGGGGGGGGLVGTSRLMRSAAADRDGSSCALHLPLSFSSTPATHTYLLRHGLQVHGIVVRLHAEPHVPLEGPDPCCFGDLDGLDAHAGDGKGTRQGPQFCRKPSRRFVDEREQN